MPRWALFAARDGDVFRDEIDLNTEEAAQAWAASELAREFKLEGDARYDLDEAFAQCDGGFLELSSWQPVNSILQSWAKSQVNFLNDLGVELNEELREERKACKEALHRLSVAAAQVA